MFLCDKLKSRKGSNNIWNMFRSNDVDINNLISNRINHPTEEMGQIFAYELVKTMFEN